MSTKKLEHPAGPFSSEQLEQRRQQDLECLTLLKEAAELRLESEYLDTMFSTLKHSFDPEDAVNEALRKLDE